MTHVPLVFQDAWPPTSLTPSQKLYALGSRFYDGAEWDVRAGDYYTTSRPDLELYQVVDVREGVVYTRYCDENFARSVSEWPEAEFIKAGFGPRRVHVPMWALKPRE
jgi:hypothetical protein